MNDHLFHLEKLLNLRIMEEQRAALELASKSSEVQKLKEQISDLKSQLLKLRTAIGKENLIKLKYYFEKKGDNENIKLLGNMLALFDESVIENDKRALFYTVEEDNLLFIGKSKKRCKVTFSLKNKSIA